MAGGTSLTCDEFLDLAAAVALDAADAADLHAVEDHAARCPECAAQLDDLRVTVAVLGSGVPQVEAPATLRARVVEAVRREPRPFAVVRRLWPKARRRPRLSAAWLVAAASFVLAVVALGWVALLQVQISDLRSQALVASERAARFDRVASVLASDKLAVKSLTPAQAAVPSRGYVFLDPKSGTGMLMCHDLPPVPQGHAYQVWFLRGNDRVSAGMLWPDPRGDGYTMIQLPRDLQSFESIGLTDEPGSGSQWPTTPRVIGTPLNESSQ